MASQNKQNQFSKDEIFNETLIQTSSSAQQQVFITQQKNRGKKKDLSQISLCTTVCAPKHAGRLGFSASLPPSHQTLPQPPARWVGREVPGTAGAHTNTLHDPLIPSPSCERKVSLPLHVVFETLASNQWSLMKWNLLLTHPGRGNPQWQPSPGS